MNPYSKLAALVLVCLTLAACNQPVEDKAAANESTSNDAEGNNVPGRKLPECAKRNKDGTYKHTGGCSQDEWIEWQKTQDAKNAPSN